MVRYSIDLLPKEKLYPAFGIVNLDVSSIDNQFHLPKKVKIGVRKDLPKIVRNFVIQHEIGHIWYVNNFKSSAKMPALFHEIMANLYGIVKNPLGFLCTIILSFSPSRLKLYFIRLINEEKVREMFRQKLKEFF